MSIKANLKIILKAGDTVVAEIEDSVLWSQVLGAIKHGSDKKLPTGPDSSKQPQNTAVPVKPVILGDPKAKLAATLGVSDPELEGALSPSLDSPYLVLNKHNWQAMTEQTPDRGPGAISPAALSATLLRLWFDAAGIKEQVTPKLVNKVLTTSLGYSDHNASRGISHTIWLKQLPGGRVIINPDKNSKAIGVARSFCTGSWGKAE